MKRVTIGVDPGQRTGVAVYDRPTNALLELQTLNFWAFFRWLLKHYPPDAAEIVLENAKLRNVTFAMHKRQLNQKYGLDALLKVVETISRKVGQVQGASELLAQGLVSFGYTVCEVPPAPPGVKKWDRAQLAQFTGWTKSSNEHERDAARLCFGVREISAPWLRQEQNDGQRTKTKPRQSGGRKTRRAAQGQPESPGVADQAERGRPGLRERQDGAADPQNGAVAPQRRRAGTGGD